MLDLPGRLAADDVLALPARAALFEALSDRRAPATTRDLAAAVGLHPNGVRTHLDRLARAGLVVRVRREGRRGRPADTWAISPSAAPGGRPPSAYHELARWLARVLSEGPDELKLTGRAIGCELGERSAGAGVDAVEPALAAMGFAPRRMRADAGTIALRLRNCPYCDAAIESQEAVCGLHRAITDGLIDALAPGAELTRFAVGDPRTAGCVVEIADRR